MRVKAFITAGILFLAGHGFCVTVVNDGPDSVNYLPADSCAWKSKVIVCPEKISEKDKFWTGPDFFQDEFGKPCVFTEDWIKEQGFASGKYSVENGALVFNTGEKGFSFGFGPEPKPGDYSKPSLRFGKAWGSNKKDKYRIEMELEQDVPESKWSFTTSDYDSFRQTIGGPTGGGDASASFMVKGKSPQTVLADAGVVWNLMDGTARKSVCGFKLTCQTPKANIKIKRLKIAPYSAEVFFRKTFNLKEKPVVALLSYLAPETYDLYINGKKAGSGSNIYPAGTTRKLDMTPYLKTGENVIAFRREFLSWAGGTPEWLAEGVAIDRDGNKTSIIGDKSWKCSLRPAEGWQNTGFDDSKWAAPSLRDDGIGQVTANKTSGNKVAPTGVDPAHMGMIQTSPEGREYPVFECSDKEIAFRLEMPAGAAEKLKPSLKICETETHRQIETASGEKAKSSKDGLRAFLFKIKTRETGPYTLEWTLTDEKGAVVETRSDELIIAGPIKQEKLGLENFEELFDKKLRLVRKIDCSAPVEPGPEFIDHTGMYSSPAANQGRICEANGMRYRETGGSVWSYFAYRLHLEKDGRPYIIEVVIPDDKARYIYSAVVETYPVGMHCNYNDGRRGWHTSSGTSFTGVMRPLSYKKKTIRYVYYQGSNSAAVMVMSGFRGIPAAACEINIYAVEGALPALEIPETQRLLGWHNERLSVTTLTTGVCEQPMMHDPKIRRNGHRLGWFHWYKTIERKINLLRFNGMNMSVEGIYTYTEGDYPSLKHSRNVSNQELDPFVITLLMCKHNGINCLLGVEYMVSPQLEVSGIDRVSDRQMREGAEGIHLVDRHGRQLAGDSKNGLNFLKPEAENIMLDCVKEIYDRYSGVDSVAGMMLVTGSWWAPGFIAGSFSDLKDTDVGYDDYTAGLFEKETGIKLGVDPKDPRRFQKRYDKLMGENKPLWLHWRALKVSEAIGKISDVIKTGKSKWSLTVHHGMDIQKDNPFTSPDSLRKDRDNYMAERFKEAGYPLDIWAKNSKANLSALIMAWGKYLSPSEDHLYADGWNNSDGSVETLKNFDSYFFAIHGGLDEVDNPADAADKWLWWDTSRGVFMPRGAGDDCMQEFVRAIRYNIPRVIFYGWLDCNMDTANGEQLRRFAKSFYATPMLDFKELPAADVKGVIAQAAKDKDRTYLRLVNSSPYKSDGFVTADASSARDMVYDKDLSADKGKYRVSLKPNDIRIIKMEGVKGPLSCAFEFAKEDAETVVSKARFLLDTKSAVRNVPGDKIADIYQQIERKDAFALYSIMSNYEVAAKTREAENQLAASKNQSSLLADIEKGGKGSIICASETPYTDPRGHVWLPDQKYTASGSYGSEGANFADRGNIKIENTDIPRVYQTEAYGGHVFYRIPLPKGKYNVYLHFAETYINIQKPGCRMISVKVEGVQHPELVDPFTKAGWGKPYILEMKDIPVYDGVMDIELRGGVGINGIEIEKAGK